MIVYAAIMLLTAIAFEIVAELIHRGKTDLIHDYHQNRVTDKVEYGKAFGKAMRVIAGTLALSAAVSLFGEGAMWGAIGILLVGLIVGIAAIIRVQKRYNGGVFG